MEIDYDRWPSKSGWSYSRIGRPSEEELKQALETLYKANTGPTNGTFVGNDLLQQTVREWVISDLATHFVGGIPEEWEELT